MTTITGAGSLHRISAWRAETCGDKPVASRCLGCADHAPVGTCL